MNNNFHIQLNDYVNLINSELDKYKAYVMNNVNGQKSIVEAMWYSLSAGGKRIRPVLALEFCRICGGNIKHALPAACAVEMLHTFSLIHDDLPCMDNDDYRRGRLSCHRVYGEGVALLAGDALENLAYNVIIKDSNLKAETKVRLLTSLTNAVGIDGMLGGQIIDIENEGKPVSQELLVKMYGMKTGALIAAACETGCISADADEKYIQASVLYAENLGLAFQIIDDILDITGTEEILGKAPGSDFKSNKITYASLNGIKKSKETAEKLTYDAVKALSVFTDTDFLLWLTKLLLERNK